MKASFSDIEVDYYDLGCGPAVVLVHGLAEDQRSWLNVQKSLHGFHTYAYDLRGHGKTTIGEADGTLEQLGNDLIAFLENVSGSATCVGFSLGGTVVLWAAAHRTDLIAHAVVIGTSSVVGRAAVEFFNQRIAMIKSDPGAFASALKDDTAKQLATNAADIEELAAIRLEAVGTGAGYINAARAMARMREHPLSPLVGQIVCPVDVIGADKDAFCPKKAADILCDALQQPHYTEIADAGHLISADQPEAYAMVIQTALSRGI